MQNISEAVADSFRQGHKPKANPGNKVTHRRRKLFSVIKDRTGGDAQAELDYSMKIIQKERPKIENYVLSKNETPETKLPNLILQAYKLRCSEIDTTANALGVTDGEAGIFIENDEAESELANNPEAENFVGELFAPIGIAASHLQGAQVVDNFIDPSLVSGVLNTAGGMIDKSSLRRAAQNKPSGILGFLSGGKSQYDTIRAYLQNPANAAEKQQVLAGTITDVSQLKGFGGAIPAGQSGVQVAAQDVIDRIARDKKNEMIRKNLPFIILGVVLLIVVTVIIVKHAKRK